MCTCPFKGSLHSILVDLMGWKLWAWGYLQLWDLGHYHTYLGSIFSSGAFRTLNTSWTLQSTYQVTCKSWQIWAHKKRLKRPTYSFSFPDILELLVHYVLVQSFLAVRVCECVMEMGCLGGGTTLVMCNLCTLYCVWVSLSECNQGSWRGNNWGAATEAGSKLKRTQSAASEATVRFMFSCFKG